MPDQPSKESLERAQWPECEKFYDLMQIYRFAPISKQADVLEAYENVKGWLRQQNAALVEALRFTEQWILHGMPVSARYPRGHALPEIEKALAPYAPADAPGKEQRG